MRNYITACPNVGLTLMNTEVKMMEDLLKQASIQNKIDPNIVSQILDIERKNVYKKRRNIFGDLRKLIEDSAEAEAKDK